MIHRSGEWAPGPGFLVPSRERGREGVCVSECVGGRQGKQIGRQRDGGR